MSLDLEKLRAKLNELKDPKSKNNRGDKKTWSPDPGKTNTIRLLQYPHSSDPFVEMFFHYGIGKNTIPCPQKNEGKTCPICEFGRELYRKKDLESSKKMFAKPRIYASIVDRSDSTLTPKLWGFGKEIYQTLIESLLKEDYGMFLDPLNGLDAEIICHKAADQQYPKPKLTFKRFGSRLAETDEKMKEILKAVPRIEDVFKPMTNAEILEKLTAWLELSEKDGNETVKEGKATPAEDVVNSTGSVENIKNLDEAFEKALKDHKVA